MTDALARARWRIEEGQIISHPRPHTRNHNPKKQAEQARWPNISTGWLEVGREQLCALKTPGCFHGGHATSDDAHRYHDAAHPDAWAESRHDEIRRQVEYDITDVKQGKAGGYLFRLQMELGFQIMMLLQVHGLSQGDVGPYR